ncbi:MAG TPA: hypothetical protein VMS38_07845 [Pseudorhodoferax sp.]|jgi:hypothetical protein|nr:hypothetical protein [Pseudorhodoferax sp.]
MKKWTLESPGVGVLLHLGLFALVSAVVLYSEHHAAPTFVPPGSAATSAHAAPEPQPAPRALAKRPSPIVTVSPRTVRHELPVPGGMSPRISAP